MGEYFEAGLGKAKRGRPFDMGRRAASHALSQLRTFQPCLAIAFVSSELDLEDANRGIAEVLKGCPLIGTSTAGEIANGLVDYGIVVSLIGSPHLRIRTGMGTGVSRDYAGAVDQALDEAGVSDYFNPEHPLHQMLHISAPGMPGVSPVLLIVFSPGASRAQVSRSHEIHTLLRTASANRIPIFGGSSGDYFRFKSNRQIHNGRVSEDSVTLAFIESEILFGLGISHGFSPTTKRALVTRAQGHIIYELDGRPAADVCAELLEIPLRELGDGAIWFSRFPFGTTDLYGNSLLHVPERVFADGSIQFGGLIRNDQVITLMRGTKKDIIEAGLSSYEKALRHGGLKRPSLALVLSCALRKKLMGRGKRREIALIREKGGVPVCGFYTFGEKGVSDDGLPIYANQSVSTLVFSDELNPVAELIHKGRHVYSDFTSRLNKRVAQIKAVNRINQIIQEPMDTVRLLDALARELTQFFPWAEGAFYLPSSPQSQRYIQAAASDQAEFPATIWRDDNPRDVTLVPMNSHGEHFGILSLKQKSNAAPPDEEDLLLTDTIGRLTASALHRLKLDRTLEIKLQQLEILNQLGSELSKSISANAQSQSILRHIRQILGLSMASLWLVDHTHHLLVKEALDEDLGRPMSNEIKENDERLTKWQIENSEPIFWPDTAERERRIDLLPPFPYHFVSLPILYKDKLRGILNLYSRGYHEWSFQTEQLSENIDFLKSLCAQIAIFLENRSLHKNATFFKEIHHRVKNNLQNIAGLLRMQIRRLDRISARQALNDSISRIMSIAVVHDTLSQGEIGMVDLGHLLGNLSKFSLSDQMEKPVITLDVATAPILIPSREATSLALVINELVQNALHHGLRETPSGELSIKVGQSDGHVSVTIQDNGPGLTEGFSPEKQGNLGLTIVRTLVKEELRGRFHIRGGRGTTALVTFPLPQNFYPLE